MRLILDKLTGCFSLATCEAQTANQNITAYGLLFFVSFPKPNKMFTSIFPEILFIEHSDVSMHFVLQFFVIGLLFHGVFFLSFF